MARLFHSDCLRIVGLKSLYLKTIVLFVHFDLFEHWMVYRLSFPPHFKTAVGFATANPRPYI